MKRVIKRYMSGFAGAIEIFLAALLLMGILITISDLLYKLGDLASLVFFNESGESIRLNYDIFFELAIQLVIGIEFTKMLVQHTQDNMVEILLLLVARKIVVSHNGTFDLLIGVFSIAMLFFIKRYFLRSDSADVSSGGFVFSGGTSVHEANRIVNSNIPEEYGNTLAGVMFNKLKEAGHSIKVDQKVNIGNHTLRINSAKEGLIEEVEIYKSREDK